MSKIEIDKRFKRSEIKLKRFTLLLKGIEMHPKTSRFETKEQTREVLMGFFQVLKVRITPRDYFRYKEFKVRDKVYPGTIKLELSTMEDRDLIFKQMASIKSEDLKKVQIVQDLPLSFQAEYKELDKKAYKLRKEDKVRTRVITRGYELV